MIIVFCEKCGKRVSDNDLNEGTATQAGENLWYCSACAPAAAGASTATASASNKPTQTARPVVATGATTRARKGVTTTQRRPVDGAHPAHGHAGDSSQKWLVPALAGGGVLLLVVGLVLMMKGKGKVESSGTTMPIAIAPEKPPEPPKTMTPVNPAPPTTPTTPTTPAATNPGTVNLTTRPMSIPGEGPPVEKENPPQSLAERQRQAEKEMEEYRDHRASTLLTEAKEWYKQNASDPWSYQAKLKEITKSYGSASAAAEARKLVDELGALPPPPDRLEMATSEAKDYQLIYDLDIATAAAEIKYSVDNRAQAKPFDRIAYFLELQTGGGETQYLYVSMDAFTTDVNKIGVPTTSSGARFQQNVANMNVFSNVKSIVTGTALAGGNIEFWSTNYGGNNSGNVPNATDNYDFGDGPVGDGNYGSMQVHNHDAKQTLFAFNHWVAGGGCDIGIGNCPGQNTDWTFSGNSGSYKMKRLRVLVHPK